jgi:hypothetical protein
MESLKFHPDEDLTAKKSLNPVSSEVVVSKTEAMGDPVEEYKD